MVDSITKGFFARQKTGRRMRNVGVTGRRFEPKSEEPGDPDTGDTYLADGSNWNPAGTGNAALVTRIDNSWEVVNEFSQGV